MSPVQIFLIALFIYLGSIGSIVGNTIGWYTLGRPLPFLNKILILPSRLAYSPHILPYLPVFILPVDF